MGRAHAECRRLISTHAPAGGATSAAVTDGTSRTLFLLTPLREGRPGRHRCGRQTAGDFYSRPCGRGDCIYLPEYWERLKISTHAPAGGATKCRSSRRSSAFISTHAPAGGATAQASVLGSMLIISTHAPAGGATIFIQCRIYKIKHFYSRPCGRGDVQAVRPAVVKKVFLLTPLREGRR